MPDAMSSESTTTDPATIVSEKNQPAGRVSSESEHSELPSPSSSTTSSGQGEVESIVKKKKPKKENTGKLVFDQTVKKVTRAKYEVDDENEVCIQAEVIDDKLPPQTPAASTLTSALNNLPDFLPSPTTADGKGTSTVDASPATNKETPTVDAPVATNDGTPAVDATPANDETPSVETATNDVGTAAVELVETTVALETEAVVALSDVGKMEQVATPASALEQPSVATVEEPTPSASEQSGAATPDAAPGVAAVAAPPVVKESVSPKIQSRFRSSSDPAKAGKKENERVNGKVEQFQKRVNRVTPLTAPKWHNSSSNSLKSPQSLSPQSSGQSAGSPQNVRRDPPLVSPAVEGRGASKSPVSRRHVPAPTVAKPHRLSNPTGRTPVARREVLQTQVAAL